MRKIKWEIDRAKMAPVTSILSALILVLGLAQWLWGMWWSKYDTPTSSTPWITHSGDLGELTGLRDRITDWLGLGPLTEETTKSGEWWRLCSYPLYHRSAGAGALGGFVLYILGRTVEPVLGSLRVACLLLVSAIGAGTIQCISARLEWSPATSIEGSGPLIFALLGAYGTLIPDWPVGATLGWDSSRVRARHIYWMAICGALALWSSGWAAETGPLALATAALLGGQLTSWMGYGGTRRKPMAIDGVPMDVGIPYNARLWEDTQQKTWSDFVRLELDPILEKISKTGMGSLTVAELRKLRNWRNFPEKPP